MQKVARCSIFLLDNQCTCSNNTLLKFHVNSQVLNYPGFVRQFNGFLTILLPCQAELQSFFKSKIQGSNWSWNVLNFPVAFCREMTSPLLEAVLLSLVEQVRLGAAEIDNLRASISLKEIRRKSKENKLKIYNVTFWKGKLLLLKFEKVH